MVRLANGQERDITNDEVERYVNARYISASEAYWRLYEFNICSKYPSVEKLPLHLENEQVVLFNPHVAPVVANRSPPKTKLTAYFDLNQETDESCHILYPDIYQHYMWDTSGKKWKKRKKNMCKTSSDDQRLSDTVGRIPVINLNPHQSELYFLRMLLFHKAGARSFSDLRIIDGEEHPTFQAACLKLGLLQDDEEIDRVMEEMASVTFGSSLWHAFATIHTDLIRACRTLVSLPQILHLSAIYNHRS